jgi:SOS response regulatory protein OraA/RecX
LTRVELLKKGIDRETIERAVNTIDDGSSAYRAAINHATMLLRHDHEDYIRFYRRLGSFLHRRGFDSAVIKQTVEKIWADRESLGGKAHAGLDQPE